ncbi:MAG: hypothetical protein J7K01_02250 [Thermovirga sp.]|nr:hypothetical protein [Thermovirga sp.]
MSKGNISILNKLDKEDKEKVSYFIRLLMRQSKYRKLREEISARREEIKKGETLTHDDIWDELDV